MRAPTLSFSSRHLSRRTVIRSARALALGALVSLGGAVAAPSEAAAEVRCVAAGFTARGFELPNTRARAVRGVPRRACRVALRRCERRVERLRFETGRRLPFAQCEVLRRVRVGAARPHRGDQFGYDHGGGYRGGDRSGYGRGYGDTYRFLDGPSCNFSACDHRYRSFRASDCSFQPYHGPRRRCTL